MVDVIIEVVVAVIDVGVVKVLDVCVMVEVISDVAHLARSRNLFE